MWKLTCRYKIEIIDLENPELDLRKLDMDRVFQQPKSNETVYIYKEKERGQQYTERSHCKFKGERDMIDGNGLGERKLT